MARDYGVRLVPEEDADAVAGLAGAGHVTGIRISAAIMAHPRRLAGAARLQRALDGLDAEITLDPEPDGPPTSMRTARLAWRAYGAGATHHLVLNDDAAPSPQFLGQIVAVVAARPRDVLSFFCMWSTRNSYAVRLAALLGAAWVENVSAYVPCQAVVAPANVARKVADYLEHETSIGNQRAGVRDDVDDVSVQRCLRRLGVRALLSVPSLVDHPPGASLLGHPNDQPAACVIRETEPAPQWTLAPLRPRCIPYLQYDTGRAFCDLRAAPHPHTVTTEEWLAGRGLSTRAVLDALLRELTGTPGATGLERRIGFAALYQVWLTACALGVAFGDEVEDEVGPGGRVEALRRALSRPAASDALASLAGGALHRLLSTEELAEIRAPVNGMVVEAVHFGAAAGRGLAGGSPLAVDGAARDG